MLMLIDIRETNIMTLMEKHPTYTIMKRRRGMVTKGSQINMMTMIKRRETNPRGKNQTSQKIKSLASLEDLGLLKIRIPRRERERRRT